MHNEKLHIADNFFKTRERLQIFEQPDSRLFYEQHLLLTVEKKHPKIYLKKIQQEHRFRKLNTLTVNETQLKNEIVPLQHYSFSRIDTFHISLSPAGKSCTF